MPAFVVLLLTAVVAPLCVAAGFDACGDYCCEYAARIAAAGSVYKVADSAMAVPVQGVGVSALWSRIAPVDSSQPALSLAFSAVPLRI
jgi:hypothetical protein